jgi:hypothetical protein
MWVVAARSAVLSVITGGGKWVEIKTYADPLYQHLIVTAERKFWRCVETGEELHLSFSNSLDKPLLAELSTKWDIPTSGCPFPVNLDKRLCRNA